MLPFRREILAIRSSGPRGSTDRLSQCLICGALVWSLEGDDIKGCRCSLALEPRLLTVATAAA
jgi:hypothetical protein